MRDPFRASPLVGALLIALGAEARAATALEQLGAMVGARVPRVAAFAPAGAPRAALSPAALSPVHEKNVLPAALSGHPLIVVHATRSFDEDATASAGVDALVESFKARGRSVVYLVHDQTPEGYSGWYTADRRPDHELFSEGGEHNLPLPGDEVTVAGGFFGSYDGHRGCQTLAVRDAIRMHFEASQRPFTVFLPVRALYFYEDDAGVREELLRLDPKTAPASKLRDVFDDFPRLFFLTENFSDVPAFGHPYLGGGERRNKGYRDGASVDVDGYAFELSFDGVPVAGFGRGPRKVLLKLYN